MRFHRTSFVCRLLLILVLSLAFGCGNEVKPPDEPKIFYPKAPDLPRLQFLTSFSNTGGWASPANDEGGFSLLDFVLGTKAGAADFDVEIDMPYGLGVRDGKLYVCDVGIKVVHVIDMKNRAYKRLGNKRILKNPVNITFAPDGTAYVCDTGISRVAVFDKEDKFVKYLGSARYCAPMDVAIRGDELIVANVRKTTIEAWGKDGKIHDELAKGGELPGQLTRPTNVAVAPDGRIFVADTGASVVNVHDREGTYLRSFGAPGDRPGFFARPKGIAIDDEGIVYVVDAQWQNVQMFAPSGGFLLLFGGASNKRGGMSIPACVIIDKTMMPLFERYIDPDFKAEYLLFMSNQYGANKVAVYAYGKSRTGKYIPVKHAPGATTAPAPKTGDDLKKPTTRPGATTRPAPVNTPTSSAGASSR